MDGEVRVRKIVFRWSKWLYSPLYNFLNGPKVEAILLAGQQTVSRNDTFESRSKDKLLKIS